MNRWPRTVPCALASLAVVASGCDIQSEEEAGVAVREQTDRPSAEYLTTPEMESVGFSFSEAVRMANMLYLSGKDRLLPDEASVPLGGIEAETRQTLENLRAILELHGTSIDQFAKCTVMIDDMEQWPAMNEVYVTFFPGPKPARSALGADGLALDALVEIECWATVG